MKLIDLLIEIRDSDQWSPTIDDYKERSIREPMKLAHAYDLINEYGSRGVSYRLTKNGYKVIEANGDLSILDKPKLSIQSTNTHIGDNYGSYNQSYSEKTTDKEAKTAIPIIKKILTGIFIAVAGTILAWYLTTYVLN